MPNLIELAKSYVPMLDEVYKLASCTSDLDGAPELARQGANANELIIPMLEMDGLADYDRNGGYVDGDVKMENRTVQCNFDRGRMFTVDTMDNAETAGLAFGRLAAEFIRTKVVPELDAFRFACYAGKPGTSSAEGTLASGADVIAAISAAVTEMDENEVPSDQRHLRITSTLLRAIKDMELELDLLDADELEKVDAALQAVEGDAQQDPALSQADNMRKQVGAVRKAFDTIFGEGTGLRVMGEKNHLGVALTAFAQLTDAVHTQRAEFERSISSIKAKYSPNRAQRRAAAKK